VLQEGGDAVVLRRTVGGGAAKDEYFVDKTNMT
jgi:hypothetical protein